MIGKRFMVSDGITMEMVIAPSDLSASLSSSFNKHGFDDSLCLIVKEIPELPSLFPELGQNSITDSIACFAGALYKTVKDMPQQEIDNYLDKLGKDLDWS